MASKRVAATSKKGAPYRELAESGAAEDDFAANPTPITFESQEEFSAAVRAEFSALLEDEDIVAKMAVALQPHFPGNSGKRARGRPSLASLGDHDERESIIAVAKLSVAEKMDAASVRLPTFLSSSLSCHLCF